MAQKDYALIETHYTRRQIEKFQALALETSEMVKIAEHLADCGLCHSLYQEVFRSDPDYAPFSISLSPEDWFKDDHLEYEDLMAIIDNEYDDEYLDILNIHLNVCARCREDLRDLTEFLQKIEPELAVRYSPDEQSFRSGNGRNQWYQVILIHKFRYAAIALAIVVFVILAITLVWKR